MVGNRKGRWMLDEDRLLVRLVEEYSVDGEDIDWSVLEQHFKGTRDSKQIRERWVNHLNPRIKKRKFSDDEIKIIEDECSKHKFKWARIAKKIPNATPLMIKNFYNNRLKKKNPANNRRLSTTAAITPFTINNFNHNAITSITNNIINNTTNSTNNINTITITNNHNNNYNYYNIQNIQNIQEKDFSYYEESNLKRSDSCKTVVSHEDNYHSKTLITGSGYSTNLTRNGSVRSVMTNDSAKTMVEYDYDYSKYQYLTPQVPFAPLPSPLPSPHSPHSPSEMVNCTVKEDEKLTILAAVANIISQSEPPSPTVPSSPKKPGKMSIMNLINT